MSPPAWQLQRNAFGRLVLTDEAGQAHVGVVPVRAFPIGAPDEGLSVLGSDGHELVWVDRLSALPAGPRQLLEEELAQREFTPVIQRIEAVSTFSTPSTWKVTTDRGPTSFTLRSEDDIRRLPGHALLILGSHGVTFAVRDRLALDANSRRLLDRFL
ncbi:cyanophycin metabolism-associated DUF1854 family protein [Hydrogenophaga laconesensis]|uniref:DUF1854 domain-containing protein n=1 Tax=Hydrogenophaga laconesensis TaxID=1805971 RepID=A0ABU1VB53_9BURK|nr:DUF1854 domain-containing protein [Hydrogenophaga laconesensis]MDR7094713.1 hypothetical protein [Hydrogenophaga laconesensis]